MDQNLSLVWEEGGRVGKNQFSSYIVSGFFRPCFFHHFHVRILYLIELHSGTHESNAPVGKPNIKGNGTCTGSL